MLLRSHFVSQSNNGELGSLFIWAMVLIAIVIAAFAVVSYIRRRTLGDVEQEGTGFTLADLRSMHKRGQISNEEFEKSKAILVVSLKAASDRAAKLRADQRDAAKASPRIRRKTKEADEEIEEDEPEKDDDQTPET